jgi:hypothetical protein
VITSQFLSHLNKDSYFGFSLFIMLGDFPPVVLKSQDQGPPFNIILRFIPSPSLNLHEKVPSKFFG